MALNRRNPIWPYLLVLACLFVLSIAAPRGWQKSSDENSSDELPQQRPLPQTQHPATAEIVRPTSIADVGPSLDVAADRAIPRLVETKAQFEDPAEKIAESRRFDAAAEVTVKPDHPLTLERSLSPPEETWPASSLGDSKPDGPQESVAATSPTLPADNTAATPAPPSAPVPSPPTPSPPTPTVPPSADSTAPAVPVASSEATAPPVSDTPSDAPPQPPQSQSELPQRSQSQSEPTLPSPPLESPLPTETAQPPVATPPTVPSGWPVPVNLLARLTNLGRHEACGPWIQSVRVQIEQLNQLGPQQCDQAATILNELRRLVGEAESLVPYMPELSATADLRRTQYAIVRRLDIWEQICTVRRRTASSSAAEGTEGLLEQIERYESDGLTSDAHRLAEIRRDLQASPEPDEQELARRLNVHYRNANLRIAVAAALIDRMLPEQKPTSDGVNETILGNPVRGTSTTSTKLSVHLIPDPRKWRFDLVAAGTVDSSTRMTHGPVTFINCGQATYQVRKLVVVDASGMKVVPAVADVDNSNELEGLYTSFDSVPIIRSMVRNYAMSQEQQQQDQADFETKQTVATKAMRRVDLQADPRLMQAQDNFNHNWIGPLRKLALDPAALAMETTATRLSLRSRLAGGDQLGANTPRPEAPFNSLASSQIHESTLNNLLDHLDLAGRTFALPELHKWLSEKLSRSETKIPDDLPEGVQVTFAQNDPVRVRCDGNHLELILNIAEIHDGRRHWRDFEVRAAYRPVVNGLAAQFERDGTIELGGQYKGRPEVALRGIFSKVLSRGRKLNLLPDSVARDPRMAGLEVTQLVVEDGWIATAIGPMRTVVRRPTAAKR